MYATKAEIARIFNCSAHTVYRRVEGIEAEIGRRYNNYAILDGLVSVAVFADYEKYRKHLADKNLRKYVPQFDKQEAEKYLSKYKTTKRRGNMNNTEQKDINAILVVAVEDKKMQRIAEYINKELG